MSSRLPRFLGCHRRALTRRSRKLPAEGLDCRVKLAREPRFARGELRARAPAGHGADRSFSSDLVGQGIRITTEDTEIRGDTGYTFGWSDPLRALRVRVKS